MGIENKLKDSSLRDCKHVVVVYQGRMKSETLEGVFYDLANCKRCKSTITLNDEYKEISKNIYMRMKLF